MQVTKLKKVSKPTQKSKTNGKTAGKATGKIGKTGHQAVVKGSGKSPVKSVAQATVSGKGKISAPEKGQPKSTSNASSKAPNKAENKGQKKVIATPAAKPAKKTTIKTQNQLPAKKEVVVPQQPVRKMIPVLIDDVSIGGAKIRIHNQDLTFSQTGKSRAGVAMIDLQEGRILHVHVPPSNLVEAGADALEKWQKVQAKELAAALAEKCSAEAGKSKKTTTLNPLGERTRTVLAHGEKDVTAENQHKSVPAVLRGEIRWVASSEMFTYCGLRSETINVSKRLFEAMIEIEERSRSRLSPMVSPNIPRGAKLNA